jgi:hypothetical protein
LIDFHEIIGEHSGANLASIVWNTIETYGLQKKVCVPKMQLSYELTLVLMQILSVVSDNASNNDTMMTGLEELFKNGIPFVAKHARGRCFPHTAHLSACKVLSSATARYRITELSLHEPVTRCSRRIPKEKIFFYNEHNLPGQLSRISCRATSL